MPAQRAIAFARGWGGVSEEEESPIAEVILSRLKKHYNLQV